MLWWWSLLLFPFTSTRSKLCCCGHKPATGCPHSHSFQYIKLPFGGARAPDKAPCGTERADQPCMSCGSAATLMCYEIEAECALQEERKYRRLQSAALQTVKSQTVAHYMSKNNRVTNACPPTCWLCDERFCTFPPSLSPGSVVTWLSLTFKFALFVQQRDHSPGKKGECVSCAFFSLWPFASLVRIYAQGKCAGA